MLKIGQFSKLSLTTIKTLRYYEKQGLLIPSFIDESTAYRYYQTSQLVDLSKIISLRQLGLSISEIKKIMNGDSLSKHLEKRQEVLERELMTYSNQLSRIKLIIESKEEVMNKREVTLKVVPEYIVFYSEGVINKFESIGEFILSSGEEAGEINPNIKCVEPGYCFIEYLDDEFREENIKVRYSQAVTSFGVESNKVKFKKLPKSEVLSIYHKGPYDSLRDSYSYILNWVEKNGYDVNGHIRESYIDGIWNKDDSSEWLTEIQVPVKKVSKG